MTHAGENMELGSPALTPELLFVSLILVAEILKARGVIV